MQVELGSTETTGNHLPCSCRWSQVSKRIRMASVASGTLTCMHDAGSIPGKALSASQVSIHWVLLRAPWNKYCYCSHFTNGEIEAWKKTANNLHKGIQQVSGRARRKPRKSMRFTTTYYSYYSFLSCLPHILSTSSTWLFPSHSSGLSLEVTSSKKPSMIIYQE